MKRMRWFRWIALAALVAALNPAVAEEPLAVLSADRGELVWTPKVDAAGFVLTVSRPDGTVVRREFDAGKVPSLPLFEQGAALPDGSYRYELRAVPRLSAAEKRALVAARERGEQALAAEHQKTLAAFPFIQTAMQGSFRISSGQVILEGSQQERRPANDKATPDVPVRDQVIPDDIIGQGSLCVGFDCVNNESFGFDTIRLKENSTRIKFEDTSTGSFPSTDWQLTANDSASGGANRFSIEDITSARVPFTVEGGASTNSIYVDTTGRVGFRTSTPVLDLHVHTSNTPALRLDQNNSIGFAAQTWDVAGNEANFFVRDVTGGSRLPFRIRPGAPTSSVDISADGDVGIGTASPDTKLHVLGSAAGADSTKLLVENTSGTVLGREMAELRNNGDSFLIFSSTNNAARWSNGVTSNTFVILDQADAQVEFQLQPNGNLTLSGTIAAPSSRTVKEDFAAVDSRDVLARVLEMPIATWSYKQEKGVRHMGPVSEDFYAAFKLGDSSKTITTVDSDGVALAAIQGLHREVAEKNAELAAQNAALEARNAELEGRLSALEKLVQALAAPGTGDRAAEKN